MLNFAEFDKKFEKELNFLKRDLAKIERKEVSPGVYDVEIVKLDLTKSKDSKLPMLVCWFKILSGDMEGRIVVMKQIIVDALALHKCNEFLRSISRIPISFDSFAQYEKLLADIMNEIQGRREYQLNYSIDFRGHSTYRIENVIILADTL